MRLHHSMHEWAIVKRPLYASSGVLRLLPMIQKCKRLLLPSPFIITLLVRLWNLGILLAEEGKFDEAKRLLEAASEIAPFDLTLWIVLGASSNHLYR